MKQEDRVSRWKALRQHKVLSLVLDVALIAGVFLAIHAWQTRNLPVDEPAPETFLPRLDGSGISSPFRPGEAGVVYFFAPWCTVCKTSINNLDDLVNDGSVSWGAVIALDYGDNDEVQAFIDKTGVSLPVYMGHSGTASDWSIRAYPTYYVIDAEGRISSRSVGYSTWLGMRVRVWRAGF